MPRRFWCWPILEMERASALPRLMTSLRAAIKFLTRIPIGFGQQSPTPLQRAVPWFPLVGALIGSVIGLIYMGFSQLLPSTVAAVLAVGCGIVLTDAFHIDDLTDRANPFAGGATKEAQPGIFKDSRLGTYRTSALALLLLLEMAALATLSPWVGFTSVVAAHSTGRSAAVGAAALSTKAAKKGLGVDYISEINRLRSLLGIAAGSAISVLLTGSAGFFLLAFAIPTTVLVWIWSYRSVGGIAGDSLGAIAQLSQTSVLLGAVVLNDGVCACSW